jgi:hypothetical protein
MKLNTIANHPGKSLGFLTPNEVFYERKNLPNNKTGFDSVALAS